MKHCTNPSRPLITNVHASTSYLHHLPWSGVYLNGTPAPAGQGVTEHLYSVDKHPTKEKWKYLVADDRDLKGKGTKKDVLDDDWWDEPAKEKK